MDITIYGKPACPECDKARMLCRIKGLAFRYLEMGADFSVAELHAKIGRPVRRLPQITLTRGATEEHLDGYQALRHALA